MINVGDILSAMGVFSTMGDIMSTVRNTQYRSNIMMHVGDIMSIMSTVGVFSTGGIFNLSTPAVLNTTTVLMISPT